MDKFLLADDARLLFLVSLNLMANRLDGSMFAAGRWLSLPGGGFRNICCSTCFSKNSFPPVLTLPSPPMPMPMLVPMFDGLLLLHRPSILVMSAGLLYCWWCCFEAGLPGTRVVIWSTSFVITVFLSRSGEDSSSTEWATGTAALVAVT